LWRVSSIIKSKLKCNEHVWCTKIHRQHTPTTMPAARSLSLRRLPEEARHNLKHHLGATNKHLYNSQPHHQGGVGSASPSKRGEGKHHHLTSAPVAHTQHAPRPHHVLASIAQHSRSRRHLPHQQMLPQMLFEPTAAIADETPKAVATVYTCVRRAPPAYTCIREAATTNFLRCPPSLPPDTPPNHTIAPLCAP
jgi:hypothetical protein